MINKIKHAHLTNVKAKHIYAQLGKYQEWFDEMHKVFSQHHHPLEAEKLAFEAVHSILMIEIEQSNRKRGMTPIERCLNP